MLRWYNRLRPGWLAWNWSRVPVGLVVRARDYVRTGPGNVERTSSRLWRVWNALNALQSHPQAAGA